MLPREYALEKETNQRQRLQKMEFAVSDSIHTGGLSLVHFCS